MSSSPNKSVPARVYLFGLGNSGVQTTFLIMLAMTIGILSLYADTFVSMMKVWKGSNTFAHGFLIIPFSTYMIWQKRSELLGCTPKPSAFGFALLFTSVLVWLVSSLASAQLGEHLGLVAIVCASIWSVFGTKFVKVIRFPLLFAFFAVPFGEFLVPPLMAWTANFAVWALNLTGVPVYLEGYYFSLPSGDFEVIEACSGIRYLLVTVALGSFFAFERFATWTKRIIFVGCAIVVVIVANGIRAYLVVLIAHLTDMKYFTDADHIYFGWFLFALVIALTFWIGARVSDRQAAIPSPVAVIPKTSGDSTTNRRQYFVVWSSMAFLIIALGPLLLHQFRAQLSGSWPHPYLPQAGETWEGPGPTQLSYRPTYPGADYELAGSYVGGGGFVELHGVFFAEQSQGNELVGWKNEIFDKSQWRLVSRIDSAFVSLPDSKTIQVKRALLTNNHEQILLWFWYDVGGWQTTSTTVAKMYNAIQSAFGRRYGDALLVIVTPVSGHVTDDASLRLESFLRENLAQMSDCLRTTSELTPFCSADGHWK